MTRLLFTAQKEAFKRFMITFSWRFQLHIVFSFKWRNQIAKPTFRTTHIRCLFPSGNNVILCFCQVSSKNLKSGTWWVDALSCLRPSVNSTLRLTRCIKEDRSNNFNAFAWLKQELVNIERPFRIQPSAHTRQSRLYYRGFCPRRGRSGGDNRRRWAPLP